MLQIMGQRTASFCMVDKVINRLINERCMLTVEIALKLAAAFSTTPDFWLYTQREVDLYNTAKSIKRLPKSILTAELQRTKPA